MLGIEYFLFCSTAHNRTLALILAIHYIDLILGHLVAFRSVCAHTFKLLLCGCFAGFLTCAREHFGNSPNSKIYMYINSSNLYWGWCCHSDSADVRMSTMRCLRKRQMIIKCSLSPCVYASIYGIAVLFAPQFPFFRRILPLSMCAPVNWYNCSRTTYYHFISHIHYVPESCLHDWNAKAECHSSTNNDQQRRRRRQKKSIQKKHTKTLLLLLFLSSLWCHARGIFDTEQNGFVIVLEMWAYFKFIIDVMVPCRYCWWFKPFFKSDLISFFILFRFMLRVHEFRLNYLNNRKRDESFVTFRFYCNFSFFWLVI